MGAGINTYFTTKEERRLSALAEKFFPKAENPKSELIKKAVSQFCDQLEKELKKK